MKWFASLIFNLFIGILFAQQACPVIPTPSIYEELEGTHTVRREYGVDVSEMGRALFGIVRKELERQSIELTTSDNTQITFTENHSLKEGGYILDVRSRITVEYGDNAGRFNAMMTLLQLLAAKEEGAHTIPRWHIEDTPKFKWRGLHLDVSRHFFTVDEIKRYIDLMSLYKFNKFHWHLTDDQGWRIEIKKYPKLTEIGAYRDSTVIGHYSDAPRAYDRTKYGGFYTQDEIKEVVKYAALHYIDVVPEIEMPGHSRAALAAYPNLSCTGEQLPVPGLWGIFDDIYCAKDESIEFMKDILSEVLELFPSEYIHIGGDEAPKTRWKACDNCRKVMDREGLTDTHELQSYFIREMDAYLTEQGRKLIGWDEILEGGLSPNAAVMSWRGEAGGVEAAKQGHEVVMSPTTYCYFDYYQSSHSMEPLAIGGYLPLEKVYKFDPFPKGLTPFEEEHILGGQANLWTEYIADMDHLEYMVYPRALALIQSLWCTKKPFYEQFLWNYLNYQEDYLALHDVHFAKSIHYPNMDLTRADNGVNIRFKSPVAGTRYTVTRIELEGDQDTTELSAHAYDVIELHRPTDGKDKRTLLKVSSPSFDGEVSYTFLRHSMLGMRLRLLTSPHPKYDYNGGLNLVDGIRGSLPWKGSEWLGFRDEKIEFILELNGVKQLQMLQLGFLESNGSWIYLPEDVQVYVSTDMRKWKKAKKTTRVDKKIDGIHRVGIRMNQKASYIKVQITAMKEIPEGKEGGGNAPWTFMDEVELQYEH